MPTPPGRDHRRAPGSDTGGTAPGGQGRPDLPGLRLGWLAMRSSGEKFTADDQLPAWCMRPVPEANPADPAAPEVARHSVHEPASAFHLNLSIMERPRPRGLLCTAHRIRSRPSRGHRPLYETSDHDRHEHSVQVIGRYVWRRPPVFSTRTRRGLPCVRGRSTRPPNSPVTAPYPGLPRLPPVRDIAATQSPMSSARTRHSPTSRPTSRPSEWPCKSAH